MVLGKKVAIFDWEWGRNSDPRDEQKIPCNIYLFEPSSLMDRQVELKQTDWNIVP